MGTAYLLKLNNIYFSMIHFKFLSFLFCFLLASLCSQAQMTGKWGDQGADKKLQEL
jgi:hypothetical protein